MKTIRLTVGCLLAALLAGACSHDAPSGPGIIPVPQSVEWGKGHFEMPDTLLYGDNLPASEHDDLAAWCRTSPLPLREAQSDEYAPLQLQRTGEGPAEGYRLEVSPAGVEITASDAAGLFYGLQSLCQLAEHYGGCIPAVRIDDAPRFGYRGYMLDVSRHFRDAEFVKSQLDLMARYKLNRFHWHLTDGAGWRIEIRRYPELTDFAAWRPEATWSAWTANGKRYCHRDDPAAQGGYYTQEEIREVVEYARQRHITVIPEIEMPGHSEEVTSTYPGLSCSGRPYVDADLCIGNEQTFAFVEGVLEEVMELFPSEYIHIGGDEATKRSWPDCPKCRERMRREGLAGVDELQSYMIHRVEQFLNARGRRLLGWDEILQGGLAPNATVMSWRGVSGGIEAARAGHDAIMSPSDYCYLDYCQDDPRKMVEAPFAFLPLERVYGYDPAPDSLGAEVTGRILGVQGNLWCEHVPTARDAEEHAWPRLLAVAEVGWSAPERKDFADFRTRALEAVAWMQRRGHTPFDLEHEVGPRPESLMPCRSLSTGCPVAYDPPCSEKYRAAGDGSLTDGLRGGWNYADGRWQGWLDTDVAVTVDLGRVRPVKRLAADFMQNYFADILLPESVEFSVSDDGEEFRLLGSVAAPVAPDALSGYYETYAWEGDASCRYVRLRAKHNGRPGKWIFTDEVVVE